MAGKFSPAIAAAFMLVADVSAGKSCPNNGVGIGREQLCNFSGKGTVCGETLGYITAPGSDNMVATKALNNHSDESCGDYSGGASVECDGDKITGARPPGAGHYNCSPADIVTGGGFGSFTAIVACCQPS